MDQLKLNTFADTLGVKYSVLDNLTDGRNIYRGSIVLTNNSPIPLHHWNWQIYFCHIRMFEPEHMPAKESYVYEDINICIKHINGCFFALEPTEEFKPLKIGESLTIDFKAEYHSVAKTDILPNWYITSEGLEPRIIQSTRGEELSFISDFDTAEKWKRFDYELSQGGRRRDLYDPWTPEVRYDKNANSKDTNYDEKLVIPSPYKIEHTTETNINLGEPGWAIWSADVFKLEADYLAGKFNLPTLDLPESEAESRAKTIILENKEIHDDDQRCKSHQREAYQVQIESSNVRLSASHYAGMFYAIQSLLSLRKSDNSIPRVNILDFPRFEYRGLHLDVSRNFHTKDEVLTLLDMMSQYKLNKLHLHLTDDEGWRLEIPGLEELTKVGGRRGHDLKEETCLLPSLGSGPESGTYPGSGYYSVQDYRQILQYAVDRHIEVIPEIDMPGHCHAAIVAMTARCRRLQKEGKPDSEACQYLLTDLQNQSHVQSVQMFSDNVLDPGMETTFTFIDKVVKEVKDMHQDISPLRMFHLGGDEVPYEAWLDSPKCQELIVLDKVKNVTDIMGYFIKRVAGIVHSRGLDVAAWQDGVVMKKTDVFERADFENDNFVVYAWKNVWETGMAADSVKLANGGYKVVMAQATHLYFDHPYEPDPDERGLYWSGRFLDTRKVFSFMPDRLYDNADVKITGEPFTEEEVKKLALQDNSVLLKPENIIGMQGHLWTETVRTREQLQEMITPRLIALAERAWHRASWEDIDDRSELQRLQKKDWTNFSSTLATQEFPRLDKMGIAYYLPPPGAKVDQTEQGRELRMNCAYPGLPLYYSEDGGGTWLRYTQPVAVTDATITLVTRSIDGKRSSRHVQVKL